MTLAGADIKNMWKERDHEMTAQILSRQEILGWNSKE
jgi:hypothetical protein